MRILAEERSTPATTPEKTKRHEIMEKDGIMYKINYFKLMKNASSAL